MDSSSQQKLGSRGIEDQISHGLDSGLRRNDSWAPFLVAPIGILPDPTRPIHTKEGIGDRVRAAAFAEIQAREAFQWGADRFDDAPAALRQAWRGLAGAEDRHLRMLMGRLTDLGIDIKERPVSARLWESLVACTSARQFALFMANSEERGRRAGERFRVAMAKTDPKTASVFGEIAEEEVAHIALAYKYFGQLLTT